MRKRKVESEEPSKKPSSIVFLCEDDYDTIVCVNGTRFGVNGQAVRSHFGLLDALLADEDVPVVGDNWKQYVLCETVEPASHKNKEEAAGSPTPKKKAKETSDSTVDENGNKTLAKDANENPPASRGGVCMNTDVTRTCLSLAHVDPSRWRDKMHQRGFSERSDIMDILVACNQLGCTAIMLQHLIVEVMLSLFTASGYERFEKNTTPHTSLAASIDDLTYNLNALNKMGLGQEPGNLASPIHYLLTVLMVCHMDAMHQWFGAYLAPQGLCYWDAPALPDRTPLAAWATILTWSFADQYLLLQNVRGRRVDMYAKRNRNREARDINSQAYALFCMSEATRAMQLLKLISLPYPARRYLRDAMVVQFKGKLPDGIALANEADYDVYYCQRTAGSSLPDHNKEQANPKRKPKLSGDGTRAAPSLHEERKEEEEEKDDDDNQDDSTKKPTLLPLAMAENEWGPAHGLLPELDPVIVTLMHDVRASIVTAQDPQDPKDTKDFMHWYQDTDFELHMDSIVYKKHYVVDCSYKTDCTCGCRNDTTQKGSHTSFT
jgi:hypothetical protein